MLVDNTNGYLDEVKASEQAKAITGDNALTHVLAYLDGYASHRRTRCLLFKDWAPLSFGFLMQVWHEPSQEFVAWFHGGVIYHGPVDGYGSGAAPSFSVTLAPTHGWSVHT